MRTTTLLLAAALLTAAPAAAQTTAFAVGGGPASVRIAAAVTIPTFLRAEQTQAFAQTHDGQGFTEFLAIYSVRGNTAWTLDAEAIPAGVTLLDVNGDWTATPAAIGTGTRTNGADVLVRVRVTAEAPADWAQQLRLDARPF